VAGVLQKQCKFRDGFKTDYDGSLKIRKGNDIDIIFVRKENIPFHFRKELDKAASLFSCDGMKKHVLALSGSPHGHLCLKCRGEEKSGKSKVPPSRIIDGGIFMAGNQFSMQPECTAVPMLLLEEKELLNSAPHA
jgi:hypothetical protein